MEFGMMQDRQIPAISPTLPFVENLAMKSIRHLLLLPLLALFTALTFSPCLKAGDSFSVRL
jgi:hypothetical protein